MYLVTFIRKRYGCPKSERRYKEFENFGPALAYFMFKWMEKRESLRIYEQEDFYGEDLTPFVLAFIKDPTNYESEVKSNG